jgi:hypothetical protein
MSLPRTPQEFRASRNGSDQASLKAREQLDQKIATESKDAGSYLDLARVNAYLLDVYEMRREKKPAVAAVDRAIDLTLHAVQLNTKSAEAHSLLADLYGRKISLGVAMFLGPKFGPKVKEENAKAIALDDKNPVVWASLGRQYLMAPKMFGGDVAKAIESFQKSLPWMHNRTKPGSGSPKLSRSMGRKPKPATRCSTPSP